MWRGMTERPHTQHKQDGRLVAKPANTQKVKQRKAKVSEPKGRKIYKLEGSSHREGTGNVS